MTYIHHDAVIVTFVKDAAINEEIVAFRERMPEDYRRFLVGPVMGGNFWITFAMLPAGSTEKWLREWRLSFLELLRDIHRREQAKWEDGSSPDIVRLRFGGDTAFTVVDETTDDFVALSPEMADKYTTDQP